MKNIFTNHPHSVGETYFQHFKFAIQFGINMVVGGVACMIHAIFPCFFEKTGSNILFNMVHYFILRMPKIEERGHGLCPAASVVRSWKEQAVPRRF